MAKPNKIYRGMQKGAETINDNFQSIASLDRDWKTLSLTGGFETDTPEECKFKVQNNVLYIKLHNINPKQELGSSAVMFSGIPSELIENISARTPFAMAGETPFNPNEANITVFLNTNGTLSAIAQPALTSTSGRFGGVIVWPLT